MPCLADGEDVAQPCDDDDIGNANKHTIAAALGASIGSEQQDPLPFKRAYGLHANGTPTGA